MVWSCLVLLHHFFQLLEFLDNLMSCLSQREGEGRSEKAAKSVDDAVHSDEYTAEEEKAVKR